MDADFTLRRIVATYANHTGGGSARDAQVEHLRREWPELARELDCAAFAVKSTPCPLREGSPEALTALSRAA